MRRFLIAAAFYSCALPASAQQVVSTSDILNDPQNFIEKEIMISGVYCKEKDKNDGFVCTRIERGKILRIEALVHGDRTSEHTVKRLSWECHPKSEPMQPQCYCDIIIIPDGFSWGTSDNKYPVLNLSSWTVDIRPSAGR